MHYGHILIVIGLLLTSCSDGKKDSDNRKDDLRTRPANDRLLKGCITERDTLFDGQNAVSYIVLDSVYTIKVRVGGLDTILPYRFDCAVPGTLVPSVHAYYNNMVCLIVGAGQHYRLFTILYPGNNGIVIKEYETALATDLKNDLVAYLREDSLRTIKVEKIRTGRETQFRIPDRFSSTGIAEAMITDRKLKIKFSDGRQHTFALPE